MCVCNCCVHGGCGRSAFDLLIVGATLRATINEMGLRLPLLIGYLEKFLERYLAPVNRVWLVFLFAVV